MFKHNLERMHEGVSSLLKENRYAFSDADKALLNDILIELEEILKQEKPDNGKKVFDALSLVLRYLKFFGVDNISDLF
jgi:phosphate uptake regulator